LTTRDGQGLRKLDEGIILKVSPVKVPRIIGKGGSMITMIKEKTGCRIMVGQNGIIWLSGPDSEKEKIAVNTINFIEENAHKEGLTDIVKDLLEKKEKKDEKKKG
jgi:exosome complex component RRP4